MLDFRIHTFLTVCQYMNFTRAARELHITQPAVSQHIRYLENFYETQLFAQDGRGISLTPSGELLLTAATTLKNDEKYLKKLLKNQKSPSAPIHFGITMTIGEFVISHPLSIYQKEFHNSLPPSQTHHFYIFFPFIFILYFIFHNVKLYIIIY